MKAAILARGGSIWRTWGAADRSQYDFRIAVNCAINEFQAEYLVACDPSTWGFVTGLPLIGGFFRGDLAQRGDLLPTEMEKLKQYHPHIVDISAPGAVETSYSIEAAVHIAADMGARQIDLYGTLLYSVAPDGTVAWLPDGTDIHSEGRGLATNRDRWIDEAQRMERIINHYAEKGVAVTGVHTCM